MGCLESPYCYNFTSEVIGEPVKLKEAVENTEWDKQLMELYHLVKNVDWDNFSSTQEFDKKQQSGVEVRQYQSHK